jgi:glycosyltransferase involved in cell wall biosynthesis
LGSDFRQISARSWRIFLKIAHVCNLYFPHIGGVEAYVKNVAERLAKKHDVSVFAVDPSGRLPQNELINNVEVRRFKSCMHNETYCISKELRKFLENNAAEFDVIHAHNYHNLAAFYAVQAKGKSRFIFTPHYHGTGSTFFRSLLLKPYRLLGKKILEKADKIVCVSRYEKSLILAHFQIEDKEVVIIPHGIDFSEFRSVRRQANCSSRRSILYVGRLEKYKGIDCLIKALPKLDNGICLEIVGKGPHKKKLVGIASKLGVANRTMFCQDLSRKDLLQKYANASLVALLSKLESYSATIAEALIAGTPCVVANTSALTEWIDNENCFGLGYPIDIGELSKTVNYVLGNTHGVQLKTTKGKIQNWDRVVERIESLYKSD